MGGDGAVLTGPLALFLIGAAIVGMTVVWLASILARYVRRRWQARWPPRRR